MSSRARFVPWLLAVLVVVLDQGTKAVVVRSLAVGESIDVIGSFLRWTYVRNYGMGLGVDLLGGRLLGAISLVATLVFIFLLIRMKDEPVAIQWIFGIIIGGAIGNTIDRFAYTYVIDFIDVDLPDFLMDRWYVFNIADSAVSVGITVLVLIYLVKSFRGDGAADDDTSFTVETSESFSTGGSKTDVPGHQPAQSQEE